MRVPAIVVAVAVWLLVAGAGYAFDAVRITNKPLVTGRVVQMSHVEVVVEQGVSGLEKKIPVNEIVTINYEQDPTALKTARSQMANGHFDEALVSLEKLDPAKIARAEIRQDIVFCRAYCHAQLALSGSEEIAAAGKEMIAFVNNQQDSYHWLKANEIVGDLLVANGSFAAAENYYARLAEAPWVDYKMRAGVAIGRTLLAQRKYADALKAFDGVLAAENNDLGRPQRIAAMLGKVRVLAADKKHAEEAIKVAESALAEIHSEETDLLAQAYDALGTAQRVAGRDKEALLAFLRVELQYSSAADAHAEALFNLAQLWEERRRPDRAAQARQTLQQQYPNSHWAKQLR